MRILKPEVADKRKREILSFIIYHYLQKENPVSSSIVQSEYKNDLSSASIRKIMLELERDGYLAHPHASAGRLPTDKAYRWFVDSLMELMTLASGDRRRIVKEFDEQVQELNELFIKASHLLASVSNYAGFIISPKPLRSKVINVEFIKVSESGMIVIVITDSGAVKHYFINFDRPIDDLALRYLSEVVNGKFCGKTLSELMRGMPSVVEEIEQKRTAFAEMSKAVLERLETEAGEELFIEGVGNVLPAIGPAGVTRIANLMNFIERKKALASILETDLEKFKGVQVTLGGEPPISQMKDISLVRTVYRGGDNSIGVLGIIGPKRMEYPKMMSLVNYMGTVVNKALEKIYK
jgi:heat-inducible transcriptional repressor